MRGFLELLNDLYRSRWFHPLLLWVWIVIGAALRFTHLAAKPPWTDEFSTIAFSLGNGFRMIPLEQLLSIDTLLMPLQPNPEAGLGAVINRLMTESTHPPVYFVLTHLWLKLFPTERGLASLWAARSLAALLGVASIPALYTLGRLAFRSALAGQMAAAMMAVSPFGIYLAQEARPYTLAILLIVASLSCLIVAVRSIHHQKPLPLGTCLVWVGANSLGIAVHYFFALIFCAEALVLLGFGIRKVRLSEGKSQRTKFSFSRSHWLRIYYVAAGTLIGGLVWLPVWQSVADHKLTQWIYNDNFFDNYLAPILRILAWVITMLAMLPVEGVALPVAIASGAIVVIFLLWALPSFIAGIKHLLKQGSTRWETQALGGFVLGAIATVLGVTYLFGADLTIAARYHFVYFPAVIVLLGATLAVCWETTPTEMQGDKDASNSSTQSLSLKPHQHRFPSLLRPKVKGKTVVVLLWLMGFLGGLTVISNFGYQKPERPDLLVPIIQNVSQVPVAIATLHKTHIQTEEMMELAWEFKRLQDSSATSSPTLPVSFFLARQTEFQSATDPFEQALAQLPRPFDLWLVDFAPSVTQLERQNCIADERSFPKVNGYGYQLYHCR